MTPTSSRKNHSLRQCLDVISGVLLLFIVIGGCVALEVAKRQRHDALTREVLWEQERMVSELAQRGEGLVQERLQGHTVEQFRIDEVRQRLTQLARNLQSLHWGGTVWLGQGRSVRVSAAGEGRIAQHLKAALTWVGQYNDLFERLIDAAQPSAAAELETLFRTRSQELRVLIDGVAAEAQSQAMIPVMRASQLQLALMCAGIILFIVWVFLIRRLVTTPLHRMADGIQAMQRTGRLVKLPVLHRNELGVVASGFNELTQQVEEQKARLREHIVQLQRANAELDQLTHLKDDFLATISHQLRTPLVPILEGLRLMREGMLGSLSDDQRQFVDGMHENATQLGHLIQKALDLSLLQSGRRPLQPQPHDLAALLRQVQETWQATAQPQRSVRLSCGTLPSVYIDAHAIREVMDQLLSNALRYAPEQTEVLMTAEPRDGRVVVSVQDRGAGLSPQQVAQLFQPFAHLQTPDAPGSQGSALGLAFCRQVIERQRGAIRAESVEGQGTTISLELPLATPQVMFEHAFYAAREQSEHEHQAFGLVLVRPEDLTLPIAADLARQTEALLRRHTHRGDEFVWLDETAFVIIAVTDRAGMDAMIGRLRGLLYGAKLSAHLTCALYPVDGREPGTLLSAAFHRAVGDGTVSSAHPRR